MAAPASNGYGTTQGYTQTPHTSFLKDQPEHVVVPDGRCCHGARWAVCAHAVYTAVLLVLLVLLVRIRHCKQSNGVDVACTGDLLVHVSSCMRSWRTICALVYNCIHIQPVLSVEARNSDVVWRVCVDSHETLLWYLYFPVRTHGGFTHVQE